MQLRKRIIATAIASIVLGGAGARLALAQTTTPDVRQEDRAAERAAGDVRREDRQQQAGQTGVQVELPVPTNPAGMLDTAAVLTTVQTQVAQGTREVQFRGVAPADLQAVALNTGVLAQIAALLPSDGVERSVTLRGTGNARVRVQNENGSLRARIENVGLTADQLAQIGQQLSASGFSRVDLRAARGTRASVAMNGSGRGRNHAEDNDVRREDRREDRRGGTATAASTAPTMLAADVRREDRREDRRADRAAERAAGDVRQEDRAAERAAGDVRQEDRAAERAAGDVRREDRAAERAAGDVRREDRRIDRPARPDRRNGDRMARTE